MESHEWVATPQRLYAHAAGVRDGITTGTCRDGFHPENNNIHCVPIMPEGTEQKIVEAWYIEGFIWGQAAK